MLRAGGITQNALRDHDGVMFVVRRCLADFVAPARLDDLLEVQTLVNRLGGASAEATQYIRHNPDPRHDAVVLVRLDLVLACVNTAGRPVRWPPALRATLKASRNTGPDEERRETHGTGCC